MLHAVWTKATKPAAMASEAVPETDSKAALALWKYRHYFSLMEVKGKNVHVRCTLCPGPKTISTTITSNSNLLKHLKAFHGTTTLVVSPLAAASVCSSDGDEAPAPQTNKQVKLDFNVQ